MKRRKASNIYFAVTHFTVQCTCREKIYIFTFEVKIDHQLIVSPGPLLQKLKWLFPPGAHSYCAEDKKNGSAKEKGISGSWGGCSWSPHTSCLKTKENNTTQLTQSSYTMGLLHQLKELWDLVLLSDRRLEDGTGTWTFPYYSAQIPVQASVLWSSES